MEGCESSPSYLMPMRRPAPWISATPRVTDRGLRSLLSEPAPAAPRTLPSNLPALPHSIQQLFLSAVEPEEVGSPPKSDGVGGGADSDADDSCSSDDGGTPGPARPGFVLRPMDGSGGTAGLNFFGVPAAPAAPTVPQAQTRPSSAAAGFDLSSQRVKWLSAWNCIRGGHDILRVRGRNWGFFEVCNPTARQRTLRHPGAPEVAVAAAASAAAEASAADAAAARVKARLQALVLAESPHSPCSAVSFSRDAAGPSGAFPRSPSGAADGGGDGEVSGAREELPLYPTDKYVGVSRYLRTEAGEEAEAQEDDLWEDSSVGDLTVWMGGALQVLMSLPVHPEFLELCVERNREVTEGMIMLRFDAASGDTERHVSTRSLGIFLKHPQLQPLLPLTLKKTFLREKVSVLGRYQEHFLRDFYGRQGQRLLHGTEHRQKADDEGADAAADAPTGIGATTLLWIRQSLFDKNKRSAVGCYFFNRKMEVTRGGVPLKAWQGVADGGYGGVADWGVRASTLLGFRREEEDEASQSAESSDMCDSDYSTDLDPTEDGDDSMGGAPFHRFTHMQGNDGDLTVTGSSIGSPAVAAPPTPPIRRSRSQRSSRSSLSLGASREQQGREGDRAAADPGTPPSRSASRYSSVRSASAAGSAVSGGSGGGGGGGGGGDSAVEVEGSYDDSDWETEAEEEAEALSAQGSGSNSSGSGSGSGSPIGYRGNPRHEQRHSFGWSSVTSEDSTSLVLNVDRENFPGSILNVLLAKPLSKPIEVQFAEEPGRGDGPNREFFSYVSPELYNSSRFSLFVPALQGEHRALLVFNRNVLSANQKTLHDAQQDAARTADGSDGGNGGDAAVAPWGGAGDPLNAAGDFTQPAAEEAEEALDHARLASAASAVTAAATSSTLTSGAATQPPQTVPQAPLDDEGRQQAPAQLLQASPAPSPDSKATEKNESAAALHSTEGVLKLYCLSGKLLGCAFTGAYEIGGGELATGYYKLLLAHVLCLDDVRWVDAVLHKSLCTLMAMEDEEAVASLELYFTFSSQVQTFENSSLQDKYIEAELVPGGTNLRVTKKNRAQYVTSMVTAAYLAGVEPYFQAFATGFWTEVPPVVSRYVLTAADLAASFVGCSRISARDWEKHTSCQPVASIEQPVVRWFWQYVQSLSQTRRRQLLSFATGSSTLPAGGFASLPEPFSIELTNTTEDGHGMTLPHQQAQTRLPEAHTCFNTLVLPCYDTYETLRDRCNAAITLGNKGYHQT
eukprot:Rhum_TRINITY_DN14861_c13_g1::Rhum_TRINITY_DN14861_c13_g1_i1::g.124354::m.124354